VTLELSLDVLARLQAEAHRRGVGIDDVVSELVNHRHFTVVRPCHCAAFALVP
jgi:hypothetical protein